MNLQSDLTRYASSLKRASECVGRAILVALTALTLSRFAVADAGFAAAGGRAEKGELNTVIVYNDITLLGEKAVIRSLRKDKTQWSRLTSSISSGEQDWIMIGLLLLPQATGAARTDLRVAFENALVTAPITAIGAISPQSAILGVICGPSAQPTYDLAENSNEQRLNAVESALVEENHDLTDPSLKARFNKCADMLQDADRRFREYWSKSEKATPKGQ